jgi:hypothetical protein
MKLNKPGTPGTTYNGGKGYARQNKMGLFLRATTSFAGENKFYEKGAENDQEAIKLARDLAIADWTWLTNFLPWLRQSAHIRTMSIMLAAEAVHARLAAKQHGNKGGMSNRALIAAVLQRPDEPGEMIAYWLNTYGRAIPKPVKRGVADAVTRMLTQKQALRYDKDGLAVRLGDVIDLVHPKVRHFNFTDEDGDKHDYDDPTQGKLFEYLITDRHKREGYETPDVLTAITARDELNKLTPDERHDFARKVKAGAVDETTKWRQALAGQWEWGRSWLGAK